MFRWDERGTGVCFHGVARVLYMSGLHLCLALGSCHTSSYLRILERIPIISTESLPVSWRKLTA
jgi:hypothetical protein